jgi:hypothetical protein
MQKSFSELLSQTASSYRVKSRPSSGYEQYIPETPSTPKGSAIRWVMVIVAIVAVILLGYCYWTCYKSVDNLSGSGSSGSGSTNLSGSSSTAEQDK